MGWLYLCCIDFPHDTPGRTEQEAEEEYGHDYNPSSNPVRMNCTCSIERADQEHNA